MNEHLLGKIRVYMSKLEDKATFDPPIRIKYTPHTIHMEIRRCEIITTTGPIEGFSDQQLTSLTIWIEDVQGNRIKVVDSDTDVIGSLAIRLYSMTTEKKEHGNKL